MSADEREIRELIGAHFDALGWNEGELPDWDRFLADFHPDAVLYGAARPAQKRSLPEFVERMNGVATGGNLRVFRESTKTMELRIFGNIAVVTAASHLLENGTEENIDVSGYLLVKTDGAWKIAAHVWDTVDGSKPLPDWLAFD